MDSHKPESRRSVTKFVKNVVIGKERQLDEHGLFHKLSLVALLAWVGLGADGLSSSCYGPEEAFKALNGHTHLSLFVALVHIVVNLVVDLLYGVIDPRIRLS